MPELPMPGPDEFCCGLPPESTPLVAGIIFLWRCAFRGDQLRVAARIGEEWVTVDVDEALPWSTWTGD